MQRFFYSLSLILFVTFNVLGQSYFQISGTVADEKDK